jgi:hypothetical protein
MSRRFGGNPLRFSRHGPLKETDSIFLPSEIRKHHFFFYQKRATAARLCWTPCSLRWTHSSAILDPTGSIWKC